MTGLAIFAAIAVGARLIIDVLAAIWLASIRRGRIFLTRQ